MYSNTDYGVSSSGVQGASPSTTSIQPTSTPSAMQIGTLTQPHSGVSSSGVQNASPSTTSIQPTSTPSVTQIGTLTQPDTNISSSTTSFDIIRPNTSSSSLHVVAIITIYPQGSSNDETSNNAIQNNGGVIDPYPSPARNPFNSSSDSDQSQAYNGVTSSQNVPLGVIVGSVFAIIFGGLLLFCVLFGINKLRERKQDSESERRARRLRSESTSTEAFILLRGQEANGSSTRTGRGSMDTNEQGELERGGILVRDGGESATGSGRGLIRFANQRRPSSVPVLPENNDHSNTPLMQEWNSPSSVHPPRHHPLERSHSPTVPSPLRTNPVTGRDSPAGWI